MRISADDFVLIVLVTTGCFIALEAPFHAIPLLTVLVRYRKSLR